MEIMMMMMNEIRDNRTRHETFVRIHERSAELTRMALSISKTPFNGLLPHFNRTLGPL